MESIIHYVDHVTNIYLPKIHTNLNAEIIAPLSNTLKFWMILRKLGISLNHDTPVK